MDGRRRSSIVGRPLSACGNAESKQVPVCNLRPLEKRAFQHEARSVKPRPAGSLVLLCDGL